jgi:hypothetical protein
MRRFAVSRVLVGLLASTCLTTMVPQAHASSIEVTIAPLFGSVSFGGDPAPLVGSQLRVSSLTGIDTPLNSGVSVACVLCRLNFETGPYLGNLGPLSAWGATGSSIAITGGVNLDADLFLEIPLGSGLLTGSFTSSVLDLHLGALHFAAGATDKLDHSLLDQFFGLPNAQGAGQFRLSFTAGGSLPGAIDSTLILGGRITSVPEPDMRWLAAAAGATLIGLAGSISARERYARRSC